MDRRGIPLWHVTQTHAVLCAFLAALVAEALSDPVVVAQLKTAGIVAAVTAAVHLFGRGKRDWRRIAAAVGVAFAIGASIPPIVRADQRYGLMLAFTFGVMVLTALHVRAFFRRVVRLLAPGNYATWRDVQAVVHVWLSLIAAFTLLNRTAQPLREAFGHAGDSFRGAGANQLIDFFYFTIVVMTTLGFGDIVPEARGARMLVAAECLTSYVMFALSIGIMTRGVRSE